MCSYPAAPHDDWLDAFTQAINYLRPLEGGRNSAQAWIDAWEWAQKQQADPNYVNELEEIYAETTRRLQGCSDCSICHGEIPQGTKYVDQLNLGRVHVPCFYQRQEPGRRLTESLNRETI